MKVTENIRGYCASAVLPPVKHSVVAPPMPAPGQPSRASKLEAEADSKRELLFLYQFSTEVFERSVLECEFHFIFLVTLIWVFADCAVQFTND
jgi:hypothetical protein